MLREDFTGWLNGHLNLRYCILVTSTLAPQFNNRWNDEKQLFETIITHRKSRERLLICSPRKYICVKKKKKKNHTLCPCPNLLLPLNMTFSSIPPFPRRCTCRLSEIVQMCCVYLTLIDN